MAEMSETKTDFCGVMDQKEIFRQMKVTKDESWGKMMEHLKNDRGMDIVDLWKRGEALNYHAEYEQAAPRLALYPPKDGEAKGAMIICAGGAFIFKSWNEAEPVADYFYEKGFYTAILDYRVTPYENTDSAADGHRAIRYLRANAKKYNIAPDHIAIGGFSAGGILSNIAATTYQPGNPEAEDELERYSSRPDAVFLGYGAFPRGIKTAELGFDFQAQAKLARVSPELLLTPDCPPYFMFQTISDDPRMIANMSIRLAEMGIPFEVHTFAGGNHGNGLFDGRNEVEDYPHTAHWAQLCGEWLEMQGFGVK